MGRSVYINGQFCAADEAKISIFDRGLLFADSVYEVVAVHNGRLVDFDSHMARLDRSLGELSIPTPMNKPQIMTVMHDLVSQNALDEGLVYMQVTRGVEERDFVPGPNLTANVFLFTQAKAKSELEAEVNGVSMKSVPDQRWARRDIKTTGLLAQVLAKRAAKDADCDEALMVQGNIVTEGGATSAYIVKDGTIITRPLSNDILPGCTRKAVLALARENDLAIEERLYTLDEVYAAEEAFITGASTYVCPVVSVDGKTIGTGTRGPLVKRLQEIYRRFLEATSI